MAGDRTAAAQRNAQGRESRTDAGSAASAKANGLTLFPCNASEMRVKAFTVRLAEKDLKRLDAMARKRHVSKTALLRDWIRNSDDRTAADATAWEERNLGNRGLSIRTKLSAS